MICFGRLEVLWKKILVVDLVKFATVQLQAESLMYICKCACFHQLQTMFGEVNIDRQFYLLFVFILTNALFPF